MSLERNLVVGVLNGAAIWCGVTHGAIGFGGLEILVGILVVDSVGNFAVFIMVIVVGFHGHATVLDGVEFGGADCLRNGTAVGEFTVLVLVACPSGSYGAGVELVGAADVFVLFVDVVVKGIVGTRPEEAEVVDLKGARKAFILGVVSPLDVILLVPTDHLVLGFSTRARDTGGVEADRAGGLAVKLSGGLFEVNSLVLRLGHDLFGFSRNPVGTNRTGFSARETVFVGFTCLVQASSHGELGHSFDDFPVLVIVVGTVRVTGFHHVRIRVAGSSIGRVDVEQAGVDDSLAHACAVDFRVGRADLNHDGLAGNVGRVRFGDSAVFAKKGRASVCSETADAFPSISALGTGIEP